VGPTPDQEILDVEQQQILQRRDAMTAGDLLAKAQEPAQLVPEIGKCLEIFLQERRMGFC
jgi:hypothetical protein